MEDIKS